jgi:hypothetical protein
VTRRTWRAIGIASLVVAALAAPQSGIAQERRPSASPEELWRAYPLQPGEKAPGAGAREDGAPGATKPARAHPAAGRRPPASSGRGSDDRGIAPEVVVLLGLLGVGLLVVLALLVRSGGRGLLRRTGAGRDPPDRPAVASPRAPRAAAPTWAALRRSAWTAEIQWRSHGGASRFCVVASPPGGEDDVTMVESPSLEWPPTSDAAVESLVSAVTDLERSVVAAGWDVTDPGGAWYGRRFVWPRTDRAPEQAKAVERT